MATKRAVPALGACRAEGPKHALEPGEMKIAKIQATAPDCGSTPSEHAEAFDDALLTHAEMCYAVAFTLTEDPHAAQQLARRTLIAAWHRHDESGIEENLKSVLLTTMREWFRECCSEVPRGPENTRTLAKGT